jgi:hypothetical protein
MPLPLFSYLCKSVKAAITFYKVWLLVKAVTGGASDGYGKNKKAFQRAFNPNK